MSETEEILKKIMTIATMLLPDHALLFVTNGLDPDGTEEFPSVTHVMTNIHGKENQISLLEETIGSVKAGTELKETKE